MLVLFAVLPTNIYAEEVLMSENVPCLCKVKFNDSFEIELLTIEPTVTGIVKGWTSDDIDARTPASVGGEYTHYKYGLITLSQIEENTFKIENLSMFLNFVGWRPIIENGEYTDPKQFWDEEPGWLK
jgi:hypothetical protein